MNSKYNKCAVVVGGSGDIGTEICLKLIESDFELIILGSNIESLEKLRNITKFDLDFSFVECNLKKIENVVSAFDKIKEKHKKIDVLVNAAGVIDLGEVTNLQEEEWDEVLSVNLKSIAFVTKEAVGLLTKSKHPRIVNISSNAGRMGGLKNGLAYSASKGGVVSLTYALARKLAKDNITVNCVAPGSIKSSMLLTRSSEELNELKENIPLKRFGDPVEVANAVMYFVSKKAGFTTGAVLDVNGGMFMG